MKWFAALEARFGHLAIPGLIRGIALLNALVFILYRTNPQMLQLINLDRQRVLSGEVWRLVTYIFIPQFGGFLPDTLAVLFYIMFLWVVGDGLEQAWGAFRLNLFYLIGMIGTTVA